MTAPATTTEATAQTNPAAPDEGSEATLLEQFRALEALEVGDGSDVDARGDTEPARPRAPAAKPDEKPQGRARVDIEVAKREARREAKAVYEAKARDVEARAAKLAEREAMLGELVPERIREVIERGEFDAVAKKLGFQSWADVTDAAIRAKTSPEHKAAMKAAQEVDDLRKQLEAERSERARLAGEQASEAKRAEFDRDLHGALKAASATEVSSLAEDPGFRRAVTQEMIEYYQAHDEDMPAEEAARVVVERARATWAQLDKVFRGGGAAPAAAHAATPDRAGGHRPARQPLRSVPRTGGEQASRPRAMSHADWIRSSAAALQSALDEDEATASG
jgi:hypothetical protein